MKAVHRVLVTFWHWMLLVLLALCVLLVLIVLYVLLVPLLLIMLMLPMVEMVSQIWVPLSADDCSSLGCKPFIGQGWEW